MLLSFAKGRKARGNSPIDRVRGKGSKRQWDGTNGYFVMRMRYTMAMGSTTWVHHV